MDHPAPLGQRRPRLPQRAVSGGLYGSLKRPNIPSRLNAIRAASQPANLVGLTPGEKSTVTPFLGIPEEVVNSPDAIDEEQEDGEPPAKRTKTAGEEFRGEEGDADEDDQDDAHRVVPGSPLPTLPKTKATAKKAAGPRQHRFGVDSATRKARGVDPPAIATRVPPPKKVLDFSPWTGNHAEDLLSETAIKSGYFDKAPSNAHMESSSARLTIWPNLSQRNHHGLTLLGHMFQAVMEKRQVMGRCTAPSTFKPPPRVTVTDTKREAWLRDLASPEVPLRKQSRTIPHGIRGKLLMEQCLSKAIPLQRALWLAKCVGANELRAFRRKGVSGAAAATGESRWVREWTVHVEQFVESVVATCGQQDWQRNMTYAVKLVRAFYEEKLLDADHYLDWIVSSFSEAPVERIPIWIIMVQIYWKEITIYGRRGRRLAESILEHLQRATKEVADVNAVLKTRLQKLVAVLAVSNPGCLVISHSWERYKSLLTPKTGTHGVNTPAKSITERNERLAGPLCKTAANTRSPLLDLYDSFDSVGLDLDFEKLASQSLELVPDPSKLISSILDWASTSYRTGIARVYLAARIIAYVQSIGHDTDAIILQYLRDVGALPEVIGNYVHKVVVALIDLEVFSVGRYFQWLIASGILSASQRPTCATSLIAAIPTKDLPSHVLNTRNMLMTRLGYAVEEQELVDEIVEKISDAMTGPSPELVEPIELPQVLTVSARLKTSRQVCDRFCSMAKIFGARLGAFVVARDFLERVEDITSLVTLITAAVTTDHSALLATVTDTVHLHAESFAALGEFKRLSDSLMEQYLQLRSQQPLDRTLILALTALAQRIPQKSAFVQLLNNDLAICEQQNSLAVCSPASDSVIGMHASSLDSDDDIDTVFASGNTMDEQLMQRVFMRIVQRALKPMPPGPEPVSRVNGWFNQLRSVGGSPSFDRMALDYIRNLFSDASADVTSFGAIPSLVSSGCMTLGTFVDMAKEHSSPHVAAAVLPMFIGNVVAKTGLHECEQYAYRLQQERCQAEHTESLNALIRTACEVPDFQAEDPGLVRHIIRCVSHESDFDFQLSELGKPSETVRCNVGQMVSAILNRDARSDKVDLQLDSRSLVGAANPLSIRYCVGVLQCLRIHTAFTCDDEENLANAMLDSFANHSQVWPQLLEFAGEGVNSFMHKWAQDELLLLATNQTGNDKTDAHEHVQRCLDLLAITRKFASGHEEATVGATIVEKLQELDAQLSDVECFDDKSQEVFASALYQLRILLHLCVMHAHASPEETEAAKQTKGSLLAILCTLLVHPRLQRHRDIVEYLFDLCSLISDHLPDAAPVLAKLSSSGKLLQDNRLVSIFGSNVSVVDSWLALASPTLPPGSQHQRALSRSVSQPPQMSGRPTAPGQSLSPQQHQRMPSLGGGPGLLRHDSRIPVETKMTPFALRPWEMIPDSTPVMGENDASLSLRLFGARRV